MCYTYIGIYKTSGACSANHSTVGTVIHVANLCFKLTAIGIKCQCNAFVFSSFRSKNFIGCEFIFRGRSLWCGSKYRDMLVSRWIIPSCREYIIAYIRRKLIGVYNVLLTYVSKNNKTIDLSKHIERNKFTIHLSANDYSINFLLKKKNLEEFNSNLLFKSAAAYRN